MNLERHAVAFTVLTVLAVSLASGPAVSGVGETTAADSPTDLHAPFDDGSQALPVDARPSFAPGRLPRLASLLSLGGVLTALAAFGVADPSVGEMVQATAVANLLVAGVLGCWTVAATRRRLPSSVGALVLAITVASMASSSCSPGSSTSATADSSRCRSRDSSNR
jgi:hypothetical protein